jgi:tetratricopeptide (TPR) repeat protein
LAAGIAFIQRGRHRDGLALPIPQYGTLTNERPADETREQLADAEQGIVAELQRTSYRSSRKRDTVHALVGHSFAALAERDYLRAHVAARLALDLDKQSADAAIGYAVAASGLGNRQQTVRTLPMIKAATGLRTPNAQWATAWALVMLAEWEMAEGLLALMLRSNPDQPTFLSLLALAQLNRGKLQSGIRNAERACGVEPSNPHHVKLLIGALLTAGQVRAAERQLNALDGASEADVDHMVSWVRLSLMRSRIEDARAWAQRARDADAKWTVMLGTLFESARFDADATAVYSEALVASYYPEAYVGLARIAAHRGDREAARRHLLSALNAERPVPPNARTAISLFQEIISRLNALEERAHCTAWLAEFPPQGTIAALAGHSLIVCAPDRLSAQTRLQTIVTAMAPEAAVDVSTLAWSEAPKDQQPVRPIQPGVQSVI